MELLQALLVMFPALLLYILRVFLLALLVMVSALLLKLPQVLVMMVSALSLNALQVMVMLPLLRVLLMMVLAWLLNLLQVVVMELLQALLLKVPALLLDLQPQSHTLLWPLRQSGRLDCAPPYSLCCRLSGHARPSSDQWHCAAPLTRSSGGVEAELL